MTLRSKKPLRVVPNPFHQLDHEGRAAGVVRLDPLVSNGLRLWIGAALRAKLVEKRNDGRPHAYDRTWEHALDAVEIPDTDWHRENVRNGALVAADESTAKRASRGEQTVTFRDPLEVLRAEQAKAIAEWERDHDGDTPTCAEIDLGLPKTRAKPVTKTTDAPSGAPTP